jgi:poly(A) polymerase
MKKVVSIVKKIFQGRTKRAKAKRSLNPTVISRVEHHVSRRHISKAALKVLYRLQKAGFSAYLVGGSVRDLLLGLYPKDFDVVTNAHPEQIRRLFNNSFIIGRRFKLVHVHLYQEIIEVATFRGDTQNAVDRVQTKQGLLLRDNVYGTLEDDVWRRDFTVNALYYNIADFSVVDYTQGIEDLRHHYIRVIGDPEERYREDPARMLRAIRLAVKLNFTIEPHSLEAIRKLKGLLSQIPPARLFDKMLKVFHSGKSFAIFKLFEELGVFSILFPHVAEAIKNSQQLAFIEEAFKSSDERINQDKPINSAFLFAVLLWWPLQQIKEELQREAIKEHEAFNIAMTEVIQQQLKIISIPRRLVAVIREIWNLQYYLEHLRAKRIFKIFHHARFRAAYDFLGLRAKTEEGSLQALYQWWTIFQQGDDEDRNKLISERFSTKTKRKRKKKGSG